MKYIKILIIAIFMFIPLIVNATDVNSDVCNYINNSSCNSYQDNSIKANGTVYFSHRIYSECDGVYYKSPVYTNPEKKVICSNGNTSPYTKIVKSGCPSKGGLCSSSKFCSIIIKYDCDKTTSGVSYFTTTTTKKTTTTKRRTTNVTTTVKTTEKVKSNKKLKSLSLSNAVINFASNNYTYYIKVESNINSINVSAIPEDTTSKVTVEGNTNIVNGSVIKVIVTGIDNTVSTYVINVEKETYIMSSNAKLKNLSIEGYPINFNSKFNEYSIIIDKDVKTLNIDYELEDEKASVNISGNENLSNGSKVTINVTAEDGTENKYVIDITVKKESNFIKILFIIILILAILAGAYYLYKKFIGSKTGDKYEYE